MTKVFPKLKLTNDTDSIYFCKMSVDEEFVPIPGFENYVISKSGVIVSPLSGRIMKQRVDVKPCGYKKVRVTLIRDDGNRKSCTVSRLVAMAYIPNPEGLPTVDHVDRNSTNNTVGNLRWADMKTQAQNQKVRKPCSNTGHKFISKTDRGNYYVCILRKRFKTLEAAIEARDTFIL